MANLQKQIEILNDAMADQLPQEVISAFASSIADLKEKEIESNSVKKGMTIKPFILISSERKKIASDSLFEKYNKLVLVFFRGVWCPYCNLELNAIQKELSRIEKNGVKLLAISPQKLEYSQRMKMDNDIEFDILYDKGNTLASSMGLSFLLQDFVQPYYANLGINLTEYNGDNSKELPIPAVLVVDSDYKVTYSFVDANYMNRVDIDELIKNLE